MIILSANFRGKVRVRIIFELGVRLGLGVNGNFRVLCNVRSAFVIIL